MKEIFKKELFRVFGDKKMIFSMFILPAVLVIGIYALMGTMISNMSSKVEEHKSIVYIQNAPEGFADIAKATGFTENTEITYLTSSDDLTEIKDGILAGEKDLLVSFEPDFIKKFESYEKAGDAIPNITVSYNSTQNYSSASYSKFASTVLTALQMNLQQLRVGDLDILNVFNLQEDLIVDEDRAKGEFLAMLLPYLITFMLFSSAMGLCVDAIAGEKERGTMATLLISPVKRTDIIFGKIFSLSLLSIVSAAVYAFSMIAAMPLMANKIAEAEGEGLALNFSMSLIQGVQLVCLMVSLVLIYVAVLCLVSAFAKSTKEASTLVVPLYMVVLIAGMLTMFNDGMATPDVFYAIPVYGTALAVQGTMVNSLTLVQFLMSVGGNLLVTVICAFFVVRAFKSEKIMLNA